MKRIILIFILILEVISYKEATEPIQKLRLRKFNIFPKELLELRNSHVLRQRLIEEMEKKELESKKNELMLKEANEQQRINQFNLNSRHQIPTFLKDFLTNRFFR